MRVLEPYDKNDESDTIKPIIASATGPDGAAGRVHISFLELVSRGKPMLEIDIAFQPMNVEPDTGYGKVEDSTTVCLGFKDATLLVLHILTVLKLKGFAPPPVILDIISSVEENKNKESDVVATRRVTRTDFGDKWPLTVESGILRCHNNAVTFIPDVMPDDEGRRMIEARVYGVNGRARNLFPDITPIQAVDEQPILYQTVDRLTPSQRREIFQAIVACEDAATRQAMAEYSKADTTDASWGPGGQDYDSAEWSEIHTLYSAREQEVIEECKRELRDKYTITEEEENKISMEGAVLGWLPLTPRLKDVSPLIEAGLALCDS